MLKNKKILLALIAGVLVVGIIITATFLQKEDIKSTLPDLNQYLEQNITDSQVLDYDTYIAQHSKVSNIVDEKVLPLNIQIQEGNEYRFDVSLPACKACIELVYTIRSANESDGKCSLKINGEIPFREATNFLLSRKWNSGEVKQDERGNMYGVPLVEEDETNKTTLFDINGYHTEPFSFVFNEGINQITLTAEKGNICLESVRLYIPSNTLSYSQMSATYPKDVVKGDAKLVIEAENPFKRSHAAISEACDRNSAVTNPSFEGIQIWNTLGGDGWSAIGQNVTWKVNVKEAGCYKLAFRYKNNFKSGVSSYRKMLIDGKVPFEEMKSVQFRYGTGWQSIELSNENGTPYWYYFDAGEHEITLEATLGEQAQALNLAQKIQSKLSSVYRKIVMVTGASPDQYRDYQIKEKLPDAIQTAEEQIKLLKVLAEWVNIKNNGKGEGTVTIDKLIWQMEEFVKIPDSIPQNLSSFLENITGLSDWIQSSTSQPLVLDCIELLPENAVPRKADASFLKRLSYATSLFVKSFAADYGKIGNIYEGEESIDVWITQGRDQYQIMKEQIDNYFVYEKNIGVNLKLVAGGILEATVAGIEPDVYLFADAGMPVNFAARGAVADLSQFADYEEVSNRFAKESIVPFEYDGGVYGVPITQSFLVLFARDDILAEIGLSVPKTWDEVYNCLTILQQNHMDFAFPVPPSGYELFLFQKQRSFYKNQGKAVAIDSEAGLWAFEQWTKLYSKYSAQMSYSFVNRFRTGDMPIGIADFSTFNTLEVSAPEINGLWNMYPIPASVQGDGSLQNISTCSSDAAMILKTTKQPEKAWEFIKWFTDEEEQYRYAVAIENRQGTSGRFSTANISAFNRLGWKASILETLNQQRKTAYAVEQVPGGYFLSRHLNNIFRKIINEDADVRETVLEYAGDINKEITKKRKEFGLEVDK